MGLIGVIAILAEVAATIGQYVDGRPERRQNSRWHPYASPKSSFFKRSRRVCCRRKLSWARRAGRGGESCSRLVAEAGRAAAARAGAAAAPVPRAPSGGRPGCAERVGYVLRTEITWTQPSAAVIGCFGVNCWRRVRD